MFSRRDSAPTPAPAHADSLATTPLSPTSSPAPAAAVAPAPAAPQTPAVVSVPAPAGGSNESVVAEQDTFEGTWTSANGVRVLGTVRGRIEAQRYVRVEPGAHIEADIVSQEVVVAGTFRGNLTCHNRVEIAASGRVRGKIDTNKLSLHEGGFFDGELHMQPPADEAAPPAPLLERERGAS